MKALEKYKAQDAIEIMRDLVRAFGYCNESFNTRYAFDELLQLRFAWIASEWDIAPDQWSEAQLTDALRYGIAPAFDANEQPLTYEAR
jgi:hypothetical protein